MPFRKEKRSYPVTPSLPPSTTPPGKVYPTLSMWWLSGTKVGPEWHLGHMRAFTEVCGAQTHTMAMLLFNWAMYRRVVFFMEVHYRCYENGRCSIIVFWIRARRGGGWVEGC